MTWELRGVGFKWGGSDVKLETGSLCTKKYRWNSSTIIMLNPFEPNLIDNVDDRSWIV